jgi:predicted esterase
MIFFNKDDSSKIKEKENHTVIIPAQKNHSATVIFLHGLGDNAKNSKELFEPISKNFP